MIWSGVGLGHILGTRVVQAEQKGLALPAGSARLRILQKVQPEPISQRTKHFSTFPFRKVGITNQKSTSWSLWDSQIEKEAEVF